MTEYEIHQLIEQQDPEAKQRIWEKIQTKLKEQKTMENLLTINIIADENGEKEIQILYNGYNIIQETIYDDELAGKILDLVNENRQSDPNDKF